MHSYLKKSVLFGLQQFGEKCPSALACVVRLATCLSLLVLQSREGTRSPEDWLDSRTFFFFFFFQVLEELHFHECLLEAFAE